MGNNIYYRSKPMIDFDINQTLYTAIKELNARNMNMPAVGFFGYNLTYEELLNDRVERLADAYAKSGVKEGDAVAIVTVNLPLVQENLLALSKLGAISKWIDVRNKNEGLIHKINESGCKVAVIFDAIAPLMNEIIAETDLEKVLIASPKDYLNPIVKMLSIIKDKKEGKKQVIIPKNEKFIDYFSFVKSGDKNSSVKPVSFDKDRPSIIVQSSGSTGMSKSIVHTEYNFNSEMMKEAQTDLPLDRHGTMYCAIPPFIIYGLNNSIYASLAFGLKAELMPYVTDQAIYEGLGKFDFSCGAPFHYRYIYNKILELKERIETLEKENSNAARKELKKCYKEYQWILEGLNRVKVFVSGGDKISADEIQKMQQIFETTIVNGYGNNEMAGAAIISPMYGSKPESVGIPLKGLEVATFDVETCERLNDGEIGEIYMSSDNCFIEYLNNPEETKRIKFKDATGKEWIRTGDLGYVDSDGFLYLIGRSQRLIKRTAYKIAPISIENVLLKYKEINDVVVVGVPDKDDGEVPMAFIEIKEEYKNVENLIDTIKERCSVDLPDYQIPKYFEIVEKIPYHNNKQNFKELEQKGAEFVKAQEEGLALKKTKKD